MNRLKLYYLLWQLLWERNTMNVWSILRSVLNLMGPELKTALVTALQNWKKTAATTPTPVDDLICDILLFLLGV